MKLYRLSDYLWEVPRTGAMRVPARIYATEKMIGQIQADNAPQQAANVACLPGIVSASMAMPDIHWGYGFPIGGVAAFDMDNGVISPGGVGYDINCGVRLMASNLGHEDIVGRIPELMRVLFETIPSGVGSEGDTRINRRELESISLEGAGWALKNGMGTDDDLEHIEERGTMAGAVPSRVSRRAWQRGLPQAGTLGSGNHFLEVGFVSEVFDRTAADAFGLVLDQVTAFIHSGSRGFGHQVCDDYLSVMGSAAQKYSIVLPDRQLACAPVRTEEAQAYLGAMRCAVNFAFANRQIMAHKTRTAFQRVLGRDVGLRTVYEVAHNIAKIERHVVDGTERELCVHRKGATRAFGPGHEAVPGRYRSVGQPVLVPGDMGRCSYVLSGTREAMDTTFGSACHGAGRRMSRMKAKKAAQGRDIVRELFEKGITVISRSRGTLAEEISDAYKDVSDVVDACVLAGLSRKVAKITPLGCIKG